MAKSRKLSDILWSSCKSLSVPRELSFQCFLALCLSLHRKLMGAGIASPPWVPGTVPRATLPRTLGGHCHLATLRTRRLGVSRINKATHVGPRCRGRDPSLAGVKRTRPLGVSEVWGLPQASRTSPLGETSFLLPQIPACGMRQGRAISGCGKEKPQQLPPSWHSQQPRASKCRNELNKPFFPLEGGVQAPGLHPSHTLAAAIYKI